MAVTLGTRILLFLGITFLVILGIYYWRPVFYVLPGAAAILLVVVSARALAPELQDKIPRPIRILLVCLLSAVGIGGVVSNRLQRSEQDTQASKQLERIENSINRLVAEGKLTKEDAAKILSRVSH